MLFWTTGYLGIATESRMERGEVTLRSTEQATAEELRARLQMRRGQTRRQEMCDSLTKAQLGWTFFVREPMHAGFDISASHQGADVSRLWKI